MESPVIIHIPHASALIPEEERSRLVLSDEDLEQELLRMTDRYTDELFDLGEEAIRVIFPVSRLVCDPERFLDDTKESMAARGMGAVYTKTSDGRPLRPRPDPGERQRLLDAYYFPHHQWLEEAVRSTLADHGRCLIIDAHSFPSSPLLCDENQDPDRPDACIGTDDFHTPAWLERTAVRAFSGLGWSVAVNRPYLGALVPLSLYGKDECVRSVMVELNRKIYMDEHSGERSADFGQVRLRIRAALLDITSSHLAEDTQQTTCESS